MAKASQRLGFLKRSLRGSPYRLREMAFDALVRSAIEYGGSIWDPSVKTEVNRIERIQRLGARSVRGARGWCLSLNSLMTLTGTLWLDAASISASVYSASFSMAA